MNIELCVKTITGKSYLTEIEDAEKIFRAIKEAINKGDCVSLSFHGIKEFISTPIRVLGFHLYDGTERYLHLHKDVEIIGLDVENERYMHAIIDNVHRYMQRQTEYDEAWKMYEDEEDR